MPKSQLNPPPERCRYSQSPVSMKAVSASMWLLTVSAGNFIIMLVAETKFFERAGEVSEC
jgi:dipeptide/tripeptide permease